MVPAIIKSHPGGAALYMALAAIIAGNIAISSSFEPSASYAVSSCSFTTFTVVTVGEDAKDSTLLMESIEVNTDDNKTDQAFEAPRRETNLAK